MVYTLPSLPYAYDALEPFIDARTMEIHHKKHHQAYVDGLNAVLNEYPDMRTMPLEQLLKIVDTLPASLKKGIEDFGGGHYNHSFFWESMQKGCDKNCMPAPMEKIIIDTFGTVTLFQEQFMKAGKSLFGSGWVWLVINNKHQLSIVQTPNQKTPLTDTVRPLLGLDVWEHAYYLHYQNRRVDYINAWWHVVNWDVVLVRYKEILR